MITDQMRSTEAISWPTKVLIRYFLTTFVIPLPALMLYGRARLTGRLPDEATWALRGGNHGPWWDDVHGVLIGLTILALMALPIISFVSGIILCFSRTERRLVIPFRFSALALFQFIAGVLFFWALFWTID